MIEHKPIAIENCLTCGDDLHPRRIAAQLTHCVPCEPRALRTRAVQADVPNRYGLLRPVLVREIR